MKLVQNKVRYRGYLFAQCALQSWQSRVSDKAFLRLPWDFQHPARGHGAFASGGARILSSHARITKCILTQANNKSPITQP